MSIVVDNEFMWHIKHLRSKKAGKPLFRRHKEIDIKKEIVAQKK